MNAVAAARRPATAHARILWLCSEIDVPAMGGGSIYSVGLARALADAGCDVTVLGLSRGTAPTDDVVRWRLVEPSPRRRLRGVVSVHPLMTARLDMGGLQAALADELDHGWDLVVANHLMTCWAVPQLDEAVESGRIGAWWYASQNDEVAIWKEAARSANGRLARIARLVDLPRIARAQRRMVRHPAAVTAITVSDLGAFAFGGAEMLIHAPPGRSTPHSRWLRPSAERPPTVVIAGSTTWRLKLEDLQELLSAAAAPWCRAGISIVVAGKMFEPDRAALASRFPDVTFLGTVPDLQAVYALGRLAVIHEPHGGGFKMKALDYAFSGLPICASAGSLNGVPTDALFTFATLAELVGAVPALVHDTARLDAARLAACSLFDGMFQWHNSARTMLGALGAEVEGGPS